jgi:hypothetical protein
LLALRYAGIRSWEWLRGGYQVHAVALPVRRKAKLGPMCPGCLKGLGPWFYHRRCSGKLLLDCPEWCAWWLEIVMERSRSGHGRRSGGRR